MPTQNQLDRSVCSICGHKFVEDEPLYAVNGNTCMSCYENKDITVNIGGHEIPQKLLSEYAAAVEAVRRGAVIADSRTDPLILVRKEQNRVDAHKRIFEAAGIKYDDRWDNTFQTELDKWLDANTKGLDRVVGNLVGSLPISDKPSDIIIRCLDCGHTETFKADRITPEIQNAWDQPCNACGYKYQELLNEEIQGGMT